MVTHPRVDVGNRRFDPGLSHHPGCPCREVISFFPLSPPGGCRAHGMVAQRKSRGLQSRGHRFESCPSLQRVRWPARLSPFAAGRNAAPGATTPGLVIPGCPYTDPSGHGLPLVRAPSEFAAPRIHHGSVVPAEGPPNFIHLSIARHPGKTGPQRAESRYQGRGRFVSSAKFRGTTSPSRLPARKPEESAARHRRQEDNVKPWTRDSRERPAPPPRRVRTRWQSGSQ